jgi:hypothetical protein
MRSALYHRPKTEYRNPRLLQEAGDIKQENSPYKLMTTRSRRPFKRLIQHFRKRWVRVHSEC